MNKVWWLILAGLLVYLPSFGNKFVWDDEQFIYENVYITDWKYLPNIFTENTIAGAGQVSNYYRPLTTLSFLIDHQIWGLNVLGFHLTNTLLHIGAGLFLYKLLKELKLGEKASFWTAMIFLVHPVQTEAVVYANSRGDPMFTFWLMVGLYLYAKSFTGKAVRIPWFRKPLSIEPSWLIAGSVVSYTLSLLSKEIGLAGAGLYVLAGLWQGRGGKWVSKYIMQLWGLFGLGAVAGGWMWLRLTVLNFANSLNFYGGENVYTESLWVRTLTYGKIFWTYMKLLAWPTQLHMERSSEVFLDLNPWFLGMIVTIGVMLGVGLLEWKKYKRKLVWLGMGWFGAMMVPVSGIVPINGLLYEHWLYVPMVGVLIVLVGLLRLLPTGVYKKLRKYAGYGLSVMVISYGMLTIKQNWIWGTPIRFYEYTLQYGDSARLHNNLAMAYSDEQRYEEAITEYEKAIEMADVYPQTHYNLGNVYIDLGEWEKAEAAYRRSLELDRQFVLAYPKLVEVLGVQERYEDALPYIELLISLNEDNPRWWLLKGGFNHYLGDEENAEEAFEKARRLGGNDPRVEQMIEKVKGGI